MFRLERIERGAPLTSPTPSSLLDWCTGGTPELCLHPTSAAHHLWTLERTKKEKLHSLIKRVCSCTVLKCTVQTRKFTVQKPTLDLGLFWFHRVFYFFPFKACPYGRRWLRITVMGSCPHSSIPAILLKASTSDASHFDVPNPYRAVGRFQITHTLSRIIIYSKLFVMCESPAQLTLV